MTAPLEQVLADARGRAAVLRHEGHPAQADAMERLCASVATAAHEFLEWLSEDDASRRSNHRPAWLRARFLEWERSGNARRAAGGRREYRMLVVPKGANESAAYEQGRDAGRAEGRAAERAPQ